MKKGIDFTKLSKTEKNFIRKATHRKLWQREIITGVKSKCNDVRLVDFDQYGIEFIYTSDRADITELIQAITPKLKSYSFRIYDSKYHDVIDNLEERLKNIYTVLRVAVSFHRNYDLL